MCLSSSFPSGHQNYMLCVLCGSFCYGGLTIVGGLAGMAGPHPVGCQAMLCVETASP